MIGKIMFVHVDFCRGTGIKTSLTNYSWDGYAADCRNVACLIPNASFLNFSVDKTDVLDAARFEMTYLCDTKFIFSVHWEYLVVYPRFVHSFFDGLTEPQLAHCHLKS